MSNNPIAQAPDIPEMLEAGQSCEDVFDNPDFANAFDVFSEDFDTEIIFFNRQDLLIDGADEYIDLIITDDPDSPTLLQMLVNGGAENLYSILDANGDHIPMVRDVEALITTTNPEIANTLKNIQTWDDLKSYGIELDQDNSILTLLGWHSVASDRSSLLNGDTDNFYTTTYENGNGLRLETTLRAANQGLSDYALRDSTQLESDDLQNVIMLVQDGNC